MARKTTKAKVIGVTIRPAQNGYVIETQTDDYISGDTYVAGDVAQAVEVATLALEG